MPTRASTRRRSRSSCGASRSGRRIRPLLYHLACVEARAGKRDDALEHLSLAVTGDPKLRDHAKADDDFASIRDDPRFLAA